MTAESVQPQPSTPSRGWWRFRSSCLVIVICLVIGVTCAILFYRSSTRQTRTVTQLNRLLLPEPAVKILGIEASDFWQADPYVSTAKGMTYGRELANWLSTPLPAEATVGIPCDTRERESIEIGAGSLIDCRTVQTLGEFCPGPIVSFGLTADGHLWELTEDQPCRASLYIGLVVFVPIGLILGLLLILVNQLRLAIMRRRQPSTQDRIERP